MVYIWCWCYIFRLLGADLSLSRICVWVNIMGFIKGLQNASPVVTLLGIWYDFCLYAHVCTHTCTYSHEHIHVPCTELHSPVGTGRHNKSFSNICAHSPDMNVHTWFIQLVCSIDYLTPENRTVADKYNLSVILTLRWTPPGQRQGMGHPVIAPVLLPISKLLRYIIRLQP